MATQEQREAGFKAQARVCNLLNCKFVKSGQSCRAIETDKQTDLHEHYDIAILDNDKIVKKLDVKSTSLSTGNLAYTYLNIRGDYSVTVSRETNVGGIELVFVFGADFDKLYFVSMEAWYKFIADSIKKHDYHIGRTYVMSGTGNHKFRDDPIKGNLDLFEQYHVKKAIKTVMGEEVDIWTADAFVAGKMHTGVELKQNTNNKDWYFENGSRYVLVTEKLVESLCKPNGHIINV